MAAFEADFGPAPGDGADFSGLKVAFSHHARVNLEQRGISVFEVERALRDGVVVLADGGRYVIRLDDSEGGIRVMAEKSGDLIVVRTAMRADELPANAG